MNGREELRNFLLSIVTYHGLSRRRYPCKAIALANFPKSILFPGSCTTRREAGGNTDCRFLLRPGLEDGSNLLFCFSTS